jgi:hypothetical protein
MEIYPADAADFMAMFATDEACEDYLMRVRWPDGYVCPRCGSKDHWNKARGLFACRGCDHEGSVTAGTLFQDTRKPLRLWFQAMWYVVNQKNGVSALGMQKALGLKTYKTAWEWLHKLRRAMVRPGREKLSGLVEVNEAFIGGEHPGKRGRGAEGKSLIFIAAEDASGRILRIRMTMLEDASGETLTKAVQETIEAGSRIRTDGWSRLVTVTLIAKPLIKTPKPEMPLHWLIWSRHFLSDGGWGRIKERSVMRTCIIISTSLYSVSIAGSRSRGGCCFIG